MPTHDALKGKGIEVLPSGRCKVRFRAMVNLDGQPKPKQLTRTLCDLQTALHFRKAVVDQRGWAQPQALADFDSRQHTATPLLTMLTLTKYIDTVWLPDTKTRKKPETLRTEQSRIDKHIKPYFGSMRLDAIKGRTWRQFVREHTLSADTRWKVYSILHAILESAATPDDDDVPALLEENPLPRKPLETKPDPQNLPAIFEREQVERIIQEVPQQHRPAIWTFALTPLRLSEVAGLQWQDWDERKSALNIRRGAVRGAVGTPKTKATIRAIEVKASLAQALRIQRDCYWPVRFGRQPKPSDWIFPTSRGNHMNGDSMRRTVLYPAMQRADVPRIDRQAFHAFRHTAASLHAESCGNIFEVQEFLGHSNSGTTEDYIHRLNGKPNTGPAVLADHWGDLVTRSLPAAVTPQSDAIN